MKTRLVWITPNAEHIIEYCARVSSPKNQEKMEKGELSPGRLLKYCAEHKHFSVFEMASACFEIETTRAISAQILRHRSFSFQEFSQRYAKVPDIEWPEMRWASAENRQSSSEIAEGSAVDGWVDDALAQIESSYEQLVGMGVATETARMILPMCSPTKMYMAGTIRSWIHYLQVRCGEDTQKEHRLIAESIRETLAQELPVCAETFGW